MDRGALLKALAGALAAVLLCAADAPPALLLREQAWTQAGDVAYALTHAPRECLARRSVEVEIGRALFRTPAVLGGPAARLGLSCNACHASGRVNARFLLPELTDRAGHADVTSEWASHVRGDGVLNPIPIPDLAGVGEKSAFGRAREPSLRAFVRSVVEEEFQGAPLPEAGLDNLVAYVSALTPCSGDEQRLSLAAAAGDVLRTIDALSAADASIRPLLIFAARDQLAAIAERLPVSRFAAEAAELETLARELGGWRGLDAEQLQASAVPWRARFAGLAVRLTHRQRQTLFDEAALRRALSAR